VQIGKTYRVILGLCLPPSSMGLFANDPPKPGETLLKFSADSQSDIVDLADLTPGKPHLSEFVVQATGQEIRVTSETDPSATLPFRSALLNGIWIFEEAVDLEQVKLGKLSAKALFYVRCGEPSGEDAMCSVTLDYRDSGAEVGKCLIRLPHNLTTLDHDKGVSVDSPASRLTAKENWDQLLSRGAQLITGDVRLDGLYKTSLINIFLLRTKYSKMANNAEDLYVVKPGATVYNAFWYRDGSHLTAALDVAGHSEEAAKSLRLFWQSNLTSDFKSYEQQESGSWQAPINELDSQGQALWALVHHFQFSGDREWLKAAYPSIRKGALWIKNVTSQSKVFTEGGNRPMYYGLLPMGEGEAIAEGPGY
jgi:hypothetical protein